MKTLEVTDEQYAFIQRLREEISTEVVGKYGFVRERDALQYLIDNLDEDVGVDADVDFSATDDVAASVGAAIEGDLDPNAVEEISYDETAEATGGDAGAAEPAADEGADVAASEATEDDAGAGDGEDDGSDSDDSSTGAADDDDMLDEMMSLLETHDDKWEKSSSSDYRYTVTLPDGSTEDVQTKDDVRALLFKNYR